MQNWKIKRMSRKRINEWIKETDKLLYYYQRKIRLPACGLCGIVGYHCPACLWKIIENSHCANLKRELGLRMVIIDARNKNKWRTARIPMLRRWKKILKTELARRDL